MALITVLEDALWVLLALNIALVGIFGFKDMPRMFHFFFSTLVLLMFNMFLGMPFYLVAGAVMICVAGKFSTKIGYQDEFERLQTFNGTLLYLISGILVSFISCLIIGTNIYGALDYELCFLLVVIGALGGTLLSFVSFQVDDNMMVIIGSGMLMWLFSTFNYTVPAEYTALVLAIVLVVGYISYREGVLEISGMLSGAILGLLIIIFQNIWWFFIMMTFLVLGGASTRYKYSYKQSLGIAQEGVRNYHNVFGNGMVALITAVAGVVLHMPIFTIGYLGAVAAATGDTMATEVGETYRKRTVLITTFEQVPPGTDGGISPLGEFAALLSSILIGLLAVLMGIISNPFVLCFVVLGGFLGTNVDSLLGATLERKGILTNNGVNLLGTMSGALIAMALGLIML